MALTMLTASVADTGSLPSTGTGMAYLQAFKRANFCEYEHAKYEHSGRPPGGAKADINVRKRNLTQVKKTSELYTPLTQVNKISELLPHTYTGAP